MNFTITTPSYNQAAFLSQTIYSIFEQSKKFPTQYFIQDAASQDGSLEILKQAQNRCPQNIAFDFISAADKGQTNAINIGFSNLTSRYNPPMADHSTTIMAYLNSDDYYENNTFEIVQKFFDQNPEVDVVFGKRRYVDKHGKTLFISATPFAHDVLPEVCLIPQETVFWRRSIWEKSGGQLDENFHFAMDYDLWLRFLKAGAKFAYIPQVLANFRIHGNSKTQTLFESKGIQEINLLRQRNNQKPITPKEYSKKVFFYRLKYFLSLEVFWNPFLAKLFKKI